MALSSGSYTNAGSYLESVGAVLMPAKKSTEMATGTISVGNILYVPVTIAGGKTYSAIGVYHNAADTCKVRLALYSENAGRPGTLLADLGETPAVLAAGQNNLTLNMALNSGRYWVAVQYSATTASAKKTLAVAGIGIASMLEITGIYQTFTYGAFPASAGFTWFCTEGAVSAPAAYIQV